jgi:hypothetical protein
MHAMQVELTFTYCHRTHLTESDRSRFCASNEPWIVGFSGLWRKLSGMEGRWMWNSATFHTLYELNSFVGVTERDPDFFDWN